MKFKLILLLIMLSIVLYAEEKVDDASKSILQLSAEKKIPVNKLIQYLDLKDSCDVNIPVCRMDRDSSAIAKALDDFEKNETAFHFGIVLVGMFTVFVSLILVALIISQLRFINKKKRKSQPQLPHKSELNFSDNHNEDIVAAILTTLYLHELEIEENNKLLLTWKRTPLSMWKAARFIPMNEIDPSRRK